MRKTFVALAFIVSVPYANAQTELYPVLKQQVPWVSGTGLGVADFDGDGDLDVLVTGHVLINDGHGRFSLGPLLQYLPPDEPQAIGDVDGDGLADILTGWYAGAAFLFVNDGAGGFTFGPALPTNPSYYPFHKIEAIALGDVDGDGDLDACVAIVVTGQSSYGAVQPRLWLNDGTGSFSDVTTARLPAVTSLVNGADLRDYDADGDVDLMLRMEPRPSLTTPTSGFLRMLLQNDGSGSFANPLEVPGPAEPAFATVADFNADGLPDVAYVTFSWSGPPPTPGGITMNLGAGAWIPFVPDPSAAPGSILARDLTGDGASEIVRLSFAAITVHPVSATGVIGSPVQTIPESGSGGFLEDFDGDGDRDLWSEAGYLKSIALNDGQGFLVPIHGSLAMHAAPPGYLQVPGGWLRPHRRIVGDVDGDGDVDIVGCPEHGPTLVGDALVVLNDGGGTLVEDPAVFAGARVQCDASTRLFGVDYDLDGRLDVFAGWEPEQLGGPGLERLYHNDGNGWSAVVTLPAGGSTSAVLQGDLDGDGDQDLVLARGSDPVLILFNQGPAGFTAQAAVPGVWASDLALCDVDADGDLDLAVVADGLYPPRRVFINSGAAIFTLAPAAIGSPYWSSGVRAADFDGDGDCDLIFDSDVSLNDGSGVFTTVIPIPMGNKILDVFDVEGDGDVDLMYLIGGYNRMLLLGNGLGSFTGSLILGEITTPLDTPRADFDRDGDDDLLGPGPQIFTNVTRQLARGSPFRPGRPASLEVYGPANSALLLFASCAPANFAFPPLGRVLIDPVNAVLVASVTLSPSGTAVLGATIPNAPALVGLTIYWQGYLPAELRLTNRETTTILGL